MPDTIAHCGIQESNQGQAPLAASIPAPMRLPTPNRQQFLFAFDTPLTTLSYTGGAPGRNGWLVSPVVATLSIKDYSSKGIDRTEYSFDAVNWVRYTGLFTLPEGDNTFSYRSADHTGMVEAPQQQRFRIDTRAPSTQVIPSLTEQTMTLRYSVSDPFPGSGGAGVHVVVHGAEGGSFFVSGAMGTFTVSVEATEVEFWGEDLAGNVEAVHHHLRLQWQRPRVDQLSDYRVLGDQLGQRDAANGLTNLVAVSPPGDHTAPDTYWRWIGCPKAMALQIDLRTVQTIGAIRLFAHDPTKSPNAYFQTSQNLQQWNDIVGLTQVDLTPAYGLRFYPTPQALSVRAIRVVIDNTSYLNDIGYLSDLQIGIITMDGQPLTVAPPAPPPASHRLPIRAVSANGGVAALGVDGNPSSAWVVSNRPSVAQITLDLGQVRTVTALTYFVTYSGVAYHTRIELSTDPGFPAGGGQTTVIANNINTGGNGIAPNPSTGPTPPYGLNSISGFGSVRGRYVRITIINPEGNWRLGGYGELDVLGY